MGTTSVIQTFWHLIPSKSVDSFAFGCSPIHTGLVFPSEIYFLCESELNLPLSSELSSTKDMPGRGTEKKAQNAAAMGWVAVSSHVENVQ